MDIFFDGPAVDPLVLLHQRENRARLLEELAHKNPTATLLSFKLNIPGPVKNSPVLEMVFRNGLSAIEAALDHAELIHRGSSISGPEAILKVPGVAKEVKQIMVALEESTPLARLYDIDVYHNGRGISRQELGLHPRPCFLCGMPARHCNRAGTHTLTELLFAIRRIIEEDPILKEKLTRSDEA